MCFVIIKGDISSLLLYSIRRNLHVSHTLKVRELHKGVDTKKGILGSWSLAAKFKNLEIETPSYLQALWLAFKREKKGEEFVRLFDITGILVRHYQFSSRSPQ